MNDYYDISILRNLLPKWILIIQHWNVILIQKKLMYII